jgi:hypothetical protein
VIATPIPDVVAPALAITIYPSNPSQKSEVYFTITTLDNKDGSGISRVVLYVDGQVVETSNGKGTHIYTGGPYSAGTHTYNVVAVDNQNNSRADPAAGSYSFTVSGPTDQTTMESASNLWIVLAFFAVMAIIILVFAWRPKNKKSYKLYV